MEKNQCILFIRDYMFITNFPMNFGINGRINVNNWKIENNEKIDTYKSVLII